MAVNNGRDLENLVGLIQETLKDSQNTIIYTNSNLVNRSGSSRQFDVVIETTINNFKLKIAIECKDYKRAVSVDKIEAFITKCNRIPDISKKVFVSASGYQQDAIKAANEYGVDLYRVEDIDSSTIIDWFPIKRLGLTAKLKDYQFGLIINEDELIKLKSNVSASQFVFNKQVISDLNYFVLEHLKEHSRELWGHNLIAFMRNKSIDRLGKIINMPFKLEFDGGAFIINQNKSKFPVPEITGTIDTWLIEKDPDKITSKSFITNDETQAKYVSIDDSKDGRVEIVLTSNNRKMFYTDLNGNKTELTSLGIYDPKTDKFTPAIPTD